MSPRTCFGVFFFNLSCVKLFVMVNGNVFVHTGQLSRIGGQQRVLKDGSQVLVRIIADRGGGKYEGSVAGARITINSKTPLKPGSTFTATISSRNGQIFLTPHVANEQNAIAQNFELSVLNDQNLAAFIKSLNLPSDEITFHLLQQMKQLQMKLDPALLSKLHNLSLKFNGKEKRAAQLMMILAKKGLDFSEEELIELLAELGWEDQQGSGLKNKANQNQNKYKLLNKANSIKQSWQLLPYEILEGETPLASGSLGILFDDSSKLRLVNIECNWHSSAHRYLFSLEYENGNCKSLGVNAADSRELTERMANLLDKRLLARGINLVIHTEPSELLEGTACAGEDFYVFGGQV